MSGSVVIVGSYNQDHVWQVDRFPQPGETRRGSGFHTGPGGKGFNQAVACARQQASTGFIGARGDDALGKGAASLAESEGMQCRWQVHDEVPTGTAAILVDAQGQNQIIVDLAANERLDPAFVRRQSDLVSGARVLLTQMENNIDATRAALELGHEHHLTCLLNPAPVHAGLDADMLQLADVLLPNESEFAELCRRFLDQRLDADRIAGQDNEALHRLARRLGAGSVVITLGKHGCFVSHGDDLRGDDAPFLRVAAESVQPVDTTGAGDAFCGALAAGLVRFADQPFSTAIRHASRVAALATERHGAAAAMPRLDEVTTRFGRLG